MPRANEAAEQSSAALDDATGRTAKAVPAEARPLPSAPAPKPLPASAEITAAPVMAAPPPSPPAPTVQAFPAEASRARAEAPLPSDPEAETAGIPMAAAADMAPARKQMDAGARQAQSAAVAADASDDDIPPAAASQPAVRDAWLRRIGVLLQEGKREEALASLHEFRRRYPDHPLPNALRVLEAPPRDPSSH